MASEAYKTLFGWLNGTRASADAALSGAEAADAQQLLDAMIASLPDAAIVLDRDTRVIAFNAAARVIAPALARGAAASLALRVPEVVEAVRDVAASREPRTVEFSQRVPIDRWFAAHVRPLGGAPSGMILLVFHDLTPVHRAEIMRADFIANASHELRTPLASLSGFIDTLLGSARDDAEARARFLAIMKTQATRMARLIDDLLSLSRVELTEHMHPETPVDLVPIVRQVVDGLQTLAQDRNVEITIAHARCARDGRRRSRRAHARVREPRRERTQIRRERQARRHRLFRDEYRRTAPPKSWSRYATTVRALRPSIFRGSPSASIASTLRKAAPKAAPVSASRWSSTSSIATAASFRSRARPARARPSRCGCR